MADLYADLHVHSNASDGTDEPSGLPRVMIRSRVGVAALTDHDTIGGLMPFLDGCRAAGVQGVTGIEVSAQCEGGTLHLLILGFDLLNPELLTLVQWITDARTRRNLGILQRLQGMGVALSPAQVEAEAGAFSVGRPHFVSALVNGGWARHRNDAWDRFVGDKAPAYVGREKPPPGEIIETAHRAGAVVIAAHPISAVSRDINRLAPYLDTLREMGLDGVEAFHPSQGVDVANALLRWAMQRRLFCSAGSDYHGLNKPGVSMGQWGRRRMPVTPVTPLLERLGVADAVAVPAGTRVSGG
ncbi:MAG: PHP domain-containing protein [Pseudomonadota bacterium]